MTKPSRPRIQMGPATYYLSLPQIEALIRAASVASIAENRRIAPSQYLRRLLDKHFQLESDER